MHGALRRSEEPGGSSRQGGPAGLPGRAPPAGGAARRVRSTRPGAPPLPRSRGRKWPLARAGSCFPVRVGRSPLPRRLRVRFRFS